MNKLIVRIELINFGIILLEYITVIRTKKNVV